MNNIGLYVAIACTVALVVYCVWQWRASKAAPVTEAAPPRAVLTPEDVLVADKADARSKIASLAYLAAHYGDGEFMAALPALKNLSDKWGAP